MTYIPGGSFEASIDGNTVGATALISSGTMTLAGGDNITLSQAGNGITISGGAGGGGGTNTFGMSNLGHTSGTSGVITGTALNFAFAGGNNITLSQSINASSGTITISGPNQTNQTLGLYALGNTTQNSSTTLDARSLSFDGLGMISAGYSNGSIQLSATQSAQTQNVVLPSAGTQTATSGTLVFSNSNNITFGMSGSSRVTASFSQTNQNMSLYALGNTTQNSSTLLNASNLSFNGLGGASVGYSNGSIQVSAPQTVAQTNQTLGLYALGNTTQNSSTTLDARSLSFDGLGIASVGYSNGSVQISVPTGGGAGDGFNSAQFTNSTANSTMPIVWAGNSNGSGGINMGLTGSTVTANATLGLYALGNTTQNSSTTMDARTVSFNGLGMASVGYSNGSVQISVPNTNNFVGTNTIGMSNLGNTVGTSGVVTGSNFQMAFAGGNNITLSQSINASSGTITISAGIPVGITLSNWEPWPLQNTGTAVLSANTNTSGAASFIPFNLPDNVAAGYLDMVVSMNLTTGGTSVYSQSGSLNYGLYSQGTGTNNTTISQITSNVWSWAMSYNNSSITVSQPTASATNGYTYSTTGSAGVAVSSAYTGLKLIRMPISSVMTPGAYWVGLFGRASSAGFNSGVLMSFYGNANSLTGLAPMGSYSSGFTSGINVVGGVGNWMQGLGSYTSAAQTNLPSTVALSAISQNMSVIPYMKFVVS